MTGAIIIRLLIAQLLRWALFGNGLLSPLWRKFYNVPLLGYFLKCAFCQGFWLGLFIFFPSFGIFDSLMWGLISAWLALSWQAWVLERRASGE